ncbi:MAG: SDR family NAD(P)-dependent oxidoreductase [Paracoccaceae bacterium]
MSDIAPPIFDLFKFYGKTVLITGSTGGIGSAIARRFAEAGASLILHARGDTPALDQLCDELGTLTDGRVSQICADLSDAQDCQSIFKNLCDESKTVDVLINNAALQPVAAIADLTALDVQEMLSVNLRAPMMLTRDFARASGLGGSVVNICSIEALSPAKAHSHYAATKAGLLHFTRAAALELGPQKIRVNAICPGLINREGLSDDWPEGVARWQKSVPLGRLGEAADVADAALYLASEAARFVTGACLTVDGGMECVPGW